MNANMCPRRRKESPIPCTSCVLPIPDGPWTIAVRSIGHPPTRSFQSSAGKIVGTARTRRRTSRAGRKLLLLAAISANAFAPGRLDTSGANSAAVVSRARLAMPCAMPRVRVTHPHVPPRLPVEPDHASIREVLRDPLNREVRRRVVRPRMRNSGEHTEPIVTVARVPVVSGQNLWPRILHILVDEDCDEPLLVYPDLVDRRRNLHRCHASRASHETFRAKGMSPLGSPGHAASDSPICVSDCPTEPGSSPHGSGSPGNTGPPLNGTGSPGLATEGIGNGRCVGAVTMPCWRARISALVGSLGGWRGGAASTTKTFPQAAHFGSSIRTGWPHPSHAMSGFASSFVDGY